MSLALVPPRSLTPPEPPRGSPADLRSKITKRDRERYIAYKNGKSVDEIAAGEKNGTTLKVQQSIQKMLVYFSATSHEVVDARANELAIGTLDKLGALIDDVLQAEKTEYIEEERLDPTDPEKKKKVKVEIPIKVPDLKMRLQVFDKITDLIGAVRSKNGISITTNTNVQQNNALFAGSGKRSMEERLRLAREKQGLRNDDAPIIDAEVDPDEFEDEEGEIEEGEDSEEGELEEGTE